MDESSHSALTAAQCGNLKNMKEFLQRVWLLVRSVSHAAMKGGVKSPPNVFKRVLVFQSSKLGDMVCTTPVISGLKKKYTRRPNYGLWQ